MLDSSTLTFTMEAYPWDILWLIYMHVISLHHNIPAFWSHAYSASTNVSTWNSWISMVWIAMWVKTMTYIKPIVTVWYITISGNFWQLQVWQLCMHMRQLNKLAINRWDGRYLVVSGRLWRGAEQVVIYKTILSAGCKLQCTISFFT